MKPTIILAGTRVLILEASLYARRRLSLRPSGGQHHFAMQVVHVRRAPTSVLAACSRPIIASAMA